MVNPKYLSAFAILMKEKSVTRAADKLNISQPAMSATLRKLRHQFGDPLFVRVGRELIPTDRANEILEVVQQVSGLFELIDRDAMSFDPKLDAALLRIQASDYTHSVLLPNIMAALPTEAPMMKIDMRPLAFDQLERELEGGELDFAVLPDFLAPPTMQMRKIFEETFFCIMRQGHALSGGDIAIEKLAKCQHIRVTPALTKGKSRVDKAFEKANVSRDVKLTVANYNTVPEVVASTDLVSFFPSSMAKFLDARFVIKKSPLHFDKSTMSLIWHPRKQTSKSHKWARDFLVRMAPG